MAILSTIDRCLNLLPKDLIENDIIYVELDKESYELAKVEIVNVTKVDGGISLEQNVPDMGKGIIINFPQHKVIIVANKDKGKSDSFYLAFKTKII